MLGQNRNFLGPFPLGVLYRQHGLECAGIWFKAVFS